MVEPTKTPRYRPAMKPIELAQNGLHVVLDPRVEGLAPHARRALRELAVGWTRPPGAPIELAVASDGRAARLVVLAVPEGTRLIGLLEPVRTGVPLPPSLTPREREVIALALDEHRSNAQVSDELGIELATVRSHLANARRKMSRPYARRHALPAAELAGLSARERQVALKAAEGRTSAEIANDLRISPVTVGTHLTRVFRKLGVKNRCSLAALLHGATETPGNPHQA